MKLTAIVLLNAPNQCDSGIKTHDLQILANLREATLWSQWTAAPKTKLPVHLQ